MNAKMSWRVGDLPLPKGWRVNGSYYLGTKSHTEGGTKLREVIMKAEYNFSKMKGRRNPYAQKLKRQVTIRLGQDVIAYFKAMANELGIPYQQIINLYLRDCVNSHRALRWAA